MRTSLATLALLLAMTAPAGAEPAPPWILDAARRPFAPEPANRGAVVLESDQRVTVLSSGRLTHLSRGAIRIDRSEGRGQARADAAYRTDAGRVKQFRAWIVSPAGVVRPLPDSEVMDRASINEDLYNEVRVRTIAMPDLAPGMVFAWEWIVEQDEPFLQVEHPFQHELAVALSRFVLELPPGWTVRPAWVNVPPSEPVVAGATWTWELRDLAEVSDEAHRPATRALVPRLMVTAIPPRPMASAPAFGDWGEVAGWLERLIPPLETRDEARLRNEAQRVVASARSELDTLRALARSMQQIRYVSVQMGITNGGGYRPRPAPRVLERGYGDCKDKANLMRTLLGSLGRESWLVTVRDGEPEQVAEGWPSPLPFNHCILAIRLRGPHGLPAEVVHPRLGRLLIFDPTDAFTPFGDLSPSTQGGFALLVAPGADPLVRLPGAPAGSSTVERLVDLNLAENGSAAGRLVERSRGASAAEDRARIAHRDARDNRAMIVGWLRRTMPGAEVRDLVLHDDSLATRFETRASFEAPAAAQSLQRRLLVLKPPLFERGGIALHSDRPRRHPLEMRGETMIDTLVVRIPEGFDVDEIPGRIVLEGPLATFEARTESAAGRVIQVRELRIERGTISASRFAEVQAFYRRVRAAEDAPIVLARR